MRNVTSLHHLLDDVTGLARLQAGREQRQIEPLDVSPILQRLPYANSSPSSAAERLNSIRHRLFFGRRGCSALLRC